MASEPQVVKASISYSEPVDSVLALGQAPDFAVVTLQISNGSGQTLYLLARPNRVDYHAASRTLILDMEPPKLPKEGPNHMFALPSIRLGLERRSTWRSRLNGCFG